MLSKLVSEHDLRLIELMTFRTLGFGHSLTKQNYKNTIQVAIRFVETLSEDFILNLKEKLQVVSYLN